MLLGEPVNPGGTAAYGAVIYRDGQKVWQDSQIFLPANTKGKCVTSNNVAEYSGFMSILLWLKKQGWQAEEILVRGDSKLVIEQMFGHWRIKQGIYVPLALECKKILKEFPNIKGEWIPREQNDLADELSKAELKRAGVKFRIQKEEG